MQRLLGGLLRLLVGCQGQSVWQPGNPVMCIHWVDASIITSMGQAIATLLPPHCHHSHHNSRKYRRKQSC